MNEGKLLNLFKIIESVIWNYEGLAETFAYKSVIEHKISIWITSLHTEDDWLVDRCWLIFETDD